MSAFQISSCFNQQILSRPKISFDEGKGGVGGEKHLFLSKTAVVANWQVNLLFCFRA